jgi:thioesterase domain-containing protein
MARQLIEAGERVTHVFLFDSVPPGCTAPPRRARITNLYNNYRRVGWQPIQPWVRRHAANWYRRLIPQRADRTAEHEAQDRALGHSEVDGYVNLFYYFSATAERYQLTRYPVDVTVFKADVVWPVQPYDYYWTEFIDGSVEVRSVPGDHHSMFYPEYVPQLANELMNRLAEVEVTLSPVAGD